ncbi:MAG: hypothetical protein ABF536_04060 [Liquorilactobacillus mali]|uniref:hypothetical protein n=1 Tax=Liquorilactobacillus mali TaxID=1618 RepID=UPI0039EBAFF8
MTEYKKGDKVVVEIDGWASDNLNKNDDFIVNKEQFLGKLEDFQPEHEFKAGDLVEIQGEKAIVLRVVSKLETPLQVSFKTDRDVGWIRKEDVSFIKSNAIDWEDGE